MRTSSLGARLMIRLTTDETWPVFSSLLLNLVVNVNGCVAWSLPTKGITVDLDRTFLTLFDILERWRKLM